MPLVLLQHFRGNLYNWDPALAPARRVVTFDNAGVDGFTGTTPDTIEQMARDAITFIAAMEFSQADVLGFSIGSFVAQQIALVRPTIVRRLILASSAPQDAVGMHGWAPEVIDAIGAPNTSFRPAGCEPAFPAAIAPGPVTLPLAPSSLWMRMAGRAGSREVPGCPPNSGGKQPSGIST